MIKRQAHRFLVKMMYHSLLFLFLSLQKWIDLNNAQPSDGFCVTDSAMMTCTILSFSCCFTLPFLYLYKSPSQIFSVEVSSFVTSVIVHTLFELYASFGLITTAYDMVDNQKKKPKNL